MARKALDRELGGCGTRGERLKCAIRSNGRGTLGHEERATLPPGTKAAFITGRRPLCRLLRSPQRRHRRKRASERASERAFKPPRRNEAASKIYLFVPSPSRVVTPDRDPDE